MTMMKRLDKVLAMTDAYGQQVKTLGKALAVIGVAPPITIDDLNVYAIAEGIEDSDMQPLYDMMEDLHQDGLDENDIAAVWANVRRQ